MHRPRSGKHAPTLIGGTGERQTLRLVAQYGDACNLFDIPDGGKTITQKLAVLSRHCQASGRPMTDIDKTVSTRIPADQPIGDFIRHCQDVASLGIDHAIVLSAGPWTTEAVRSLAPVAAAVRDN